MLIMMLSFELSKIFQIISYIVKFLLHIWFAACLSAGIHSEYTSKSLSVSPCNPLCIVPSSSSSIAGFGVNTDAAGVAVEKRKKSLCGSCSSTACQVNIIMHIRSASSRGEGVSWGQGGGCLVFGFVEFGQVLATTTWQVNATRCCRWLPTANFLLLAFCLIWFVWHVEAVGLRIIDTLSGVQTCSPPSLYTMLLPHMHMHKLLQQQCEAGARNFLRICYTLSAHTLITWPKI